MYKMLFISLSSLKSIHTCIHGSAHTYACLCHKYILYIFHVCRRHTNLIQISFPWQPTHKGLPFPADENIKTELHKDDNFVSFIRDFAVDVFNKSYQMVWLHSTCFQLFILYLPVNCFTCKQILCQYFDKDKNENISRAKVTECKYIKVNPCYLFYMTIEAYEQGKLGVYEIELRCDLGDGKIVLDSFCLRDPKPWGM